ncbi:MAG TPA: SIS domain-containing protein [Gemmatimonadales bacterium]|nr:SIS domain-containing protein [Gemmatimonadales bacterium]
MPIASELSLRIEESLLGRNPLFQRFFDREAGRLAEACHQMSERLLRGGRLLAFGRGACATDAQHVAVEFVHPVIVGKRALPALDLSPLPGPWLAALVRPEDIVMGFAPPDGDPEVQRALRTATARGAMTFALSGSEGAYAVEPETADPFVQQELIELLYHTLWETVHVFFEHRELGHDVGPAAFLYPFLGQEQDRASELTEEVARSIVQKAEDAAALRARVAREMAEEIGEAALALHQRLARGGTLVLLGNGGSATDATDWAMDCVAPPAGFRTLPAISLALDPATITAIANDVGADVVFLRQMIAQARPEDAVVAISTSGSSRNIVAALAEARKRGLLTVALLGYDGGEIRQQGLADHCIVVGSDYIPRIQEVHASIYHIVRECLEALGRGS